MTENQKELLANIAPFGLRMQADLKERIKAAAERNGRSMNSEIVATLENAYPAFSKEFLEELSFLDQIDEIAAKLERVRAEAEEIARAREEVKKVDRAISKADDLLKKPKK
ncbi:Arc family DNA-binding protein [Sinorhizobium meliloti]|uniref:Arc family DNA-binding protein n=1 Tax=Rhizobium meliloti TaxID=382 RepID=UPI00040EFECD|nr:Arc family DNA-binding protein [Sinorhizobium meliloti]